MRRSDAIWEATKLAYGLIFADAPGGSKAEHMAHGAAKTAAALVAQAEAHGAKFEPDEKESPS